MDEAMRFEVLGPVRVWRGERELDPGFPQQRALLALLLAHTGRPVPPGGILDVLWGERPPVSAPNVVRRYVGALRRMLEPGLAPRAPGRRLLRRAGGYLLEADTDEVDLLRFRDLTRRGTRAAATGRAEAAARHLVLALGEWRGPVAMGIPESVRSHVQFTALRRELLDTTRLAADAALLCGRAEQVLPALRRAAAQDPLDEPLHARLVLALAACGLQAEALGAYEDVRRRLTRDLNVAPGPELTAAQARVLRQEAGRPRSGPTVRLDRPSGIVELRRGPGPAGPGPAAAPERDDDCGDCIDCGDWGDCGDCGGDAMARPDRIRPRPTRPSQAPAARTAPAGPPAPAVPVGPRRPAVPGHTGSRPPAPAPARPAVPRPAQLPPAPASFVGRAAESEWLDGVVGSSVPVVSVGGLAGVGKSALVVRWAHRVADRFPDGQLYVPLRGFDRTGPPVEPGDALRGLLGTLGVPPSRMPDGVDALAGLYRTLLAGRRVLVVLDDAADTGQVRALLPAGPGCLALVTSRRALPGLVVAGGRALSLAPFSMEDARASLVARIGAERSAAEPGAVDEIVARCGRLPLALAAVAARAVGRRDFPLVALAGELREAHGTLDALPGVRAAFLDSYRRLEPDAARLLRLLPRHDDTDLTPAAAAALSGLPVRRAGLLLATLADAHLLTEHAPGRYALHELVRAFAAELAGAEALPGGV
ncbi:BTAD domain-containing putative transcriptional regulator [Streptomyces sp. B21-097]|uniref:AfsR/SARP family transcriptional regulator n=1 Tax=Streptomyces sp. B21-097 TaxID=3039414 RepID=UPI002FF09B05